MQEFSSISVSTYEPDGLVGQLNDRSADGWSVVAIVPTGSTVTAYLTREATDAPEPTAASTAEPVVTTTPAVAPAPEPAAEPAPEPAPEPAAAPFIPSTTTAEAAPAAAAPEPAAEPAATSAAPAGWYADPSGRFELRYWDGATWTEHVSRAGQQYTDPPVA